MKKFFKWFGIVFLAFVLIIASLAFLGKDKTEKLIIDPVDLQQVPDGTYLGQYNGYRFTNIAEITVADHKITKIDIVKTQREELSLELAEAVISAQSPVIDTISGATLDQKAFLKAVEIALIQAAE